VAALAVVSGLVVPLLDPGGVQRVATPRPPRGRTRRRPAPVLGLPRGFRPAGVAACGDTLYVSSLRDGTVLSLETRSGRARTILAGGAGRILHGLRLDPATGLLYAVGTDDGAGILLAIDRRVGRIVRRWLLPRAGLPTDVTLAGGAVWTTDARADRLTRVALGASGRPGRTEPVSRPLPGPWPLRGPWSPTGSRRCTSGVRPRGVRALDDGRLLFDHPAGGLWVYDPQADSVDDVPLVDGPVPDRRAPVTLLDRAGNLVWAARSEGRDGVVQLRLDNRAGRLVARRTVVLVDSSLDAPAAATLAGGRLWTVNARYGVDDPAATGYWVTGLAVDRPGLPATRRSP
jgi:hypothetical protein